MSDPASTDVRRWLAPSVDGGSSQSRGQGSLMTAERLAEIEAQARAEGLAQGIEDGRKQGIAQREKEAQKLKALMNKLSPQIQVLDDQLIDQLAETVMAIARQFIRRELHHQPGEVVRVVRECLAALPSAATNVALHLHPDDAALVRDAMHLESMEQPWRLVEDATLARGGCRLETDTSTVDASVQTRLSGIAARMFGDERGRGLATAPIADIDLDNSTEEDAGER
jgi:flagellar assembly protein FliH